MIQCFRRLFGRGRHARRGQRTGLELRGRGAGRRMGKRLRPRG
ncbi:MAG TPA: hypothetical protein VFE65_18680 [Pseudonocardia sp.]|nr:hypothetical protein [Pseudonocardia sp.]